METRIKQGRRKKKKSSPPKYDTLMPLPKTPQNLEVVNQYIHFDPAVDHY